MALSGTLETFSLPDVLRLLSSTKKTGLLALDGDRGRGRVWVRDGAIVAADADRAVNEQLEGVAFELLRYADASFEFESGAETSTDGSTHDVDDVLAEAEVRLAEWREIEAVVPSLDVWVRMVEHIDADRTVTAEQWRVLARIGTGADGHALAAHLEQGEYDVCRQLRDLVTDGMLELTETPAAVRTIDVDAALGSPAGDTFAETALDSDGVSALGAGLASFVAAGTVEEPVAVDFAVPATVEVIEDDDDDAADDDDDGDDFLSQLSQLSPKAAAAVEATWTDDAVAGGVDQAEAETTEVDSPGSADEPAPAGDDVDQNLLLRFLSSAKN